MRHSNEREHEHDRPARSSGSPAAGLFLTMKPASPPSRGSELDVADLTTFVRSINRERSVGSFARGETTNAS